MHEKAGTVLALSVTMKTVIIVSKCLRVTKLGPDESWYDFHFKGVCAGVSLKRVVLKGKHDLNLKKGEEYLLYVRMLSCEDGVLKGMVLKSRRLEECWDKS